MTGNSIIIHCDGACFPNPGKGSWGAVITHSDGTKQELSGVSDEERTTNQRSEVLAAIMALEFLKEPSTVQVFSDSQYLIKCITGQWKIRANQDLLGRLKKVAKLHHVSWHWAKGHSGNEDNERADELSMLASPVPAEERTAFLRKWQAPPKSELGNSARQRKLGRVRGRQTRRARRRRRKGLMDYPRELRGLPNNRYGGQQSTRMRTYPPQLPWGSAGECRVYTEEEKRELEQKMRAEGDL